MEIEKQNIPNVMTLLWWKVNVKTFGFYFHQDFKMVENVALNNDGYFS